MDELCGPNIQIILGVKEGQGFGYLHSPVFVTGSLNGHVLETDSVGPMHAPVFATDLVWEADKKGLRQMRTGNIPLKVECNTINYQSRKERVGYILLSLRSAQIVPSNKTVTVHNVWHKLLGVKNEGKTSHPELLISLTIEDRQNRNINANQDQMNGTYTNVLPAIVPSSVSANWRHPTLVPRLCSEEGLIQIGPEQQCTDIFLLSILIGTAVNLDMLLFEKTYFDKEMESYCFWYSIFGHSIQTKPFHRDIHQPCLLKEKIVLRLRSSLEVLKVYFTEVSLMSLKLLYGRDEIGNANMDLKNLVPSNKLSEFLNRYAVNNTVTQNARCFLGLPANGEIPADANGRKPYIEMEIKLKYIAVQSSASAKTNDDPCALNTDQGQLTARSTTELDAVGTEIASPKMKLMRSNSLTSVEPEAVRTCYEQPTPRYQQASGDHSINHDVLQTLIEEVPSYVQGQKQSASTGNIQTQRSNMTGPVTTHSADSVLKKGLHLPPQNANKSVEAYHLYALDIILESVVFTKPLENRKMQFRFHHPKAEVISTVHPEIVITNPNETINLQNVRCRVNFMSTPNEISQLLLAWPPKVTVTDSDSIKLAESILDIGLLLAQEKRECRYEANIIDVSNGTSLGTVNIAMTLADCGLNLTRDRVKTEQDLGPPVLDERIAYKIVEELEDWKEKQQELFQNELSRREKARLTVLSAEWAARRAELEGKLVRGVEQCRTLATNLSRATDDLKLRANKHSEAEMQLKKMKDELEQSYSSKKIDVKEEARQLEIEVNHRVNILKNEKAELTEKIKSLERENALLKDTLETQEEELRNLRKSTLTKDQTASLLQQLRELEEKLVGAQKSKAFFKEQWGRTVREMHRLNTEHNNQLKQQIRNNKEELGTLGLQDFLNEEETQLQADQAALHRIRSDLDSLHSTVSLPNGFGGTPYASDFHMSFAPFQRKHKPFTNVSRPSSVKSDPAEKITMLMEERDLLLRTGSYTEQDPVIMKINEEIRSTNKKSTRPV